MQHIKEFIKDPGWWFSAVLIAILAAVLGAYIKDWFGNFLSMLSLRYRTRRRNKLRKSARTIRNIARDPGYMVFFAVRQTTLMIAWVGLVILYTLPTSNMSSWIVIALRSITLLMQVLFVFKIIGSVSELRRGMARYKRRRNLYDVNRPTA